MNDNLSGSLHIHNMSGVIQTVINGQAGVFIPFEPNHIATKGEKMFYNWFSFPFRDEFGNDYIVVRSKTKEETLNKINTEIVGNIKVWKPRGEENTYSAPPRKIARGQSGHTPAPPPDDDPF